jgi:hypothetical protein
MVGGHVKTCRHYTTPPEAAQPAPVQEPGPSGDYLSDFQEGQWWIAELDAAVVNGTPAQRSAVAVVRNLLATVVANTPPAAQHQCKWPTCQSEEYQQALAEQINQELVTGAAQRKPLTDEQIIEWVESGEYNVITNDWASHIEFARAIEAAHGIKENT